MTEQIQNLIHNHTLGKQECWELLQELNKIDEEKLSVHEIGRLRTSIKVVETEYDLRKIFINELKDIID